MTARWVLATLLTMVSSSSGRSERRSMTSTSMPSFSSILRGLERDVDDARLRRRSVTSLPSRAMLAEPHRHEEVGVVGDLALHAVERLALHEEDRVVVADGGLQQALGVGRHRRREHLEARACERRSAPSRASAARRPARADPLGARKTMGTLNCPPDIWRIFAALLRI